MVEAVAHALLDRVLEVDHAHHLGVARHGQRGAALAPDPVEHRLELGRGAPAFLGDELDHGVTRALAQVLAVQVDPAHPGLRGERDELRVQLGHVVLADPVLLGEHDDRAALGRLVGQRGQLRDLGQLGFGDARHRDELAGQPVADRDRARLVEQQHVDVTRGLDRTARQRQHVAAHEPVDAGDPDRRQERADRRGDQRDEQRDQAGVRDRRVGEQSERAERRHHDHEDQRQAGEQDVERDLVRRLAALGAFDQADHPVEERMPGLLGDLDEDFVRQHARTARDRAAVAAGLADDGCGLAGDRGLVDRGDALDHRAVTGDQLTGLDDYDIALAELGGLLDRPVLKPRHGLLAHSAECVRLGAPTPLGERLGVVGEDDGQP